jgi:sugar phosphate permease
MTAFALLVILKGGAKFGSMYAKKSLGASNMQGSSLQMTYSMASVAAGILGGFLYDMVPGGKKGIGALMTAFNLLNFAGWAFVLYLQLTDAVSMASLYIFMSTIGFASVLPVSLVFQVYAMAIGGVKHCGMFTAAFEFVAHFAEAALDLVTGQLLEEQRFDIWIAINTSFAFFGMIAMAIFYYLDWRRAPDAKSLVAAPDLNVRDKKSIGRAMLFAASQAQTKEDIEANLAEKSLSVFKK